MIRLLAISLALTSLASPALAEQSVTTVPVVSTQKTVSGQPIVLPQHDVQLIVTRLTLQPGATLPEHEHPYQRYGYVLSGHLKVTMSDTGRSFTYGPGDFIVEMRNQWHSANPVGNQPVVLLVIDQVVAGNSNMVLRKPG
jgi:quercetin dioxygenase-like cupin family protein